MVEFMTERLGHNAWAYIAQHKVTRRPIEDKPKKDSEVKLTTMGQAVLQQSTASKAIESLVPISGVDQFGSLERFAPNPQLVSRPVQYKLAKKGFNS